MDSQRGVCSDSNPVQPDWRGEGDGALLSCLGASSPSLGRVCPPLLPCCPELSGLVGEGCRAIHLAGEKIFLLDSSQSSPATATCCCHCPFPHKSGAALSEGRDRFLYDTLGLGKPEALRRSPTLLLWAASLENRKTLGPGHLKRGGKEQRNWGRRPGSTGCGQWGPGGGEG